MPVISMNCDDTCFLGFNLYVVVMKMSFTLRSWRRRKKQLMTVAVIWGCIWRRLLMPGKGRTELSKSVLSKSKGNTWW